MELHKVVAVLVILVACLGGMPVAAGKASESKTKIIWTKEAKKSPLFEIVREAGLFEFLAEHIDSTFNLPHGLDIVIQPCGEPNAFYDPESGEIVYCTELFDYFHEIAKAEEGEGADDLFLDVTLFTVLHEFGHALIDLCELPVTGKEEDVADQLATWFTLETIGENKEEGMAPPLAAAYFFAVEFDAQGAERDLPFWDSHSLDPRRFYNILCWVYGFDPKLTQKILGARITEILPEEREVFCVEEYAKMNEAFRTLLEPFLVR